MRITLLSDVHHVNADTKQFFGTLPFRQDVRVPGGRHAGFPLILVHGTSMTGEPGTSCSSSRTARPGSRWCA